MGLDAAGLPVGVQIVGARGADTLTITAACVLEKAGVAGWVPPPCLGPTWGSSLRNDSIADDVGLLDASLGASVLTGAKT